MSGKKGKISREKWNDNYMEWLSDVIIDAGIIDYRYNIKGCGVWLGYGFKVRKALLQIIRDLLDNTPIPHEETLFPLLIPEPIFMKEAEHVKGFEDEVYWVTHGGLDPLDIKLCLRPTSETAMYPMFKLWIRSHQDLPIKVYQIVSTFRFEGKNTRPFIRVREITSFKEAHTAHATAEEAEDQIREGLKIYSEFFDRLAIPYIINKRPPYDTFPGAEYSIAYETIFPGEHRTLQIGTVHNLGQIFAKTFDLSFEDPNGETKQVHQTCYGISERVMAALLTHHGDDNGLCLPPEVAPIQVVIIPIIFKGKEKKLLNESKKLLDRLVQAGIRAKLDDSDMSAGKKYYKWETKGVPVRIELGPKDLEKNQFLMVRRDTGKKMPLDLMKGVDELPKIFENIYKDLHARATQLMKDAIKETDDFDELYRLIEKRVGIVLVPLCDNYDCAEQIEKRTEGKIIGTPIKYVKEFSEEYSEKDFNFNCIVCGLPVKRKMIVGRPY
jgi:prolyl-tRNA synthetase